MWNRHKKAKVARTITKTNNLLTMMMMMMMTWYPALGKKIPSHGQRHVLNSWRTIHDDISTATFIRRELSKMDVVQTRHSFQNNPPSNDCNKKSRRTDRPYIKNTKIAASKPSPPYNCRSRPPPACLPKSYGRKRRNPSERGVTTKMFWRRRRALDMMVMILPLQTELKVCDKVVCPR